MSKEKLSQDDVETTQSEKVAVVGNKNISFSVPLVDESRSETEDVEVINVERKKPSQSIYKRRRSSYSRTSTSLRPGSSRLTSLRSKHPSRATTLSTQSTVDSDTMSLDEDIVTLTVPETSQKIVHCLVGTDLFVDKTWCMVKKSDILEDVAIQDANSPFFYFTQRILAYKPNELLIGYEPFSTTPNQFMLCVTEEGRDQVLSQLDALKTSYLRRIEQSKEVEPRKWESQGSEEFVDQFQIKKTRKLISLEWIGDITKRCFTQPNFEDCDPDSMKNGYTCLVPTDKEKFELIYKKTQETGTQAVAMLSEAGVQTDPEIPTNASTQYAPETEISVPDTSVTQAAMKSQDLNTFFQKYLDYLCDCLKYNEVYDLYHDDYPALYVTGEETQVQQLGTYHQYQSFTDVAAIQGKLVVSSSWHPNFTGIVAVAYADEIPCLMKELEFDSDQTDYEEEKTDEEGGEGAEETELGAGVRDWMLEEKRERESLGENTDLYDRALKRLKDIESDKVLWDAKIQEETEEVRKPNEETESDHHPEIYEYIEYREPEPELELDELEEEDEEEEGEYSEGQEGEEEEQFGTLGKEDTGSPKSKTSFRKQLEADIQEHADEIDSRMSTRQFDEESQGFARRRAHSTQESKLDPWGYSRSTSEGLSFRTATSDVSLRKRAHHRKKHRRHVPSGGRFSLLERGSVSTGRSSPTSTRASGSLRGRLETFRDPYRQQQEFFDEVTDEEEIKEKQDELPLLELNNPVLVWSFVDDLTPKLRLDSPYEVRVVEFSRHNGNLIAGGTVSGQVVLWDITGRIEELEKPELLTPNQQKIRKRMEDLMNWRRDVRSKRRVPICAISSQPDSHLEKVTQLKWISPSVMVTETMDIIKNPSLEPNLQIITCSIHGDIKLWDLRSQPIKVDVKKQVQQFKTKARFGRPELLDTGRSDFAKLHRRWKPFNTLMTSFKNVPVPLTGLYCHHVPVRYVRVTPKVFGTKEVLEDRIEFKVVSSEVTTFPLQVYISNLFGEAGFIMWEPPEVKPPEGEYFQHTCHFWESHHDGPIHNVVKHPFLPSVCLTVGGHVFAIWHSANPDEPLLTKRYYGVFITDGKWSTLRPSLIRIARSDGVVEIWDLIIQNHAPATTIIVSGRVITNISPPLLPEVRGLLGVADYNSAFRLFFIPQQFRIWTESELNRMTIFINREPERKKRMKEWSKWWRENNVNLDREEKKQAEEKKKLDEEVRLEKEKQEEARKKYNEEVYKWYMRRRGKPFLWREEAEEKWREKQEAHMHEVVMAKKKIDRTEMEILMRPIVREERNETQKQLKAQERLKQADTIFRQTVDLIFPKSVMRASEVSVEEVSFSEQINKLMEHYFGDNFEELADEQEEIVKRSPWQFDFEWSELLEKYNTLRMLFNDRRRKRSKTLRWLRKKLREELIKEGRKVHVRKSHTDRYPRKKIKRRQENLDMLKKMYGDDYNVYWDKHHPCRRFADRKFRYTLEETDSGQLLGEFTEPDVEDEDIPELFTEGKAMSSLEMITEVGIEHIPEETFSADLDATLITLESRSTIGEKRVPSLFQLSSKDQSEPEDSIIKVDTKSKSFLSADRLTVPSGYESPQDDSDVSLITDDVEDSLSLLDTQMQELDYIQQSIGTKIGTLQTQKVASSHKREVSEGVQVQMEETISDEDEEEFEDVDLDEEEEDLNTGDEELKESKTDEVEAESSVVIPDNDDCNEASADLDEQPTVD